MKELLTAFLILFAGKSTGIADYSGPLEHAKNQTNDYKIQTPSAKCHSYYCIILNRVCLSLFRLFEDHYVSTETTMPCTLSPDKLCRTVCSHGEAGERHNLWLASQDWPFNHLSMWATMWAIKRCHTKARGPKSVHTKASPEPTAFEATPYDPYANICKLRKHEMSKPSKLERSDGLQGRSDGLQGNTRDTDSQCFKELLLSWTVSLDFPSGPAQVICGEVANQCLKVITRVGDPWGPKVSESRSTSGPGSSSPKKMRLWQYLCSLRGSEAILGVSKLEGENHSEISEAAGLCESMTIIPTFNYHGPMAVYGSLFALETLYPFISCHYSFNPFDSSMRQVTSKPVRRMLQNKVSISAFGNATRSAKNLKNVKRRLHRAPNGPNQHLLLGVKPHGWPSCI